VQKKTIGIIGPGEHFRKRIFPVLKKSNFFKITGVLRKKKIKFFNINNYNSNEFFRKKFDFIYISCVTKLHEKYIIKSLNSPSHVICEKPFIVSDKKIKKILHLSRKNKKLIFENFMYVYHPAFTKLKKLIKHPNFGKIRYVISNFKLPSKNANDQRYQKNKGDGFYYDTAVYPISLENYLFNNYQKGKYEFCSEKIKNKVDLKGFIFINSTSFKRFYFWGEGQNYSNNIEIVFENSSIFVNKIFTKSDKENILIKIFFKNKIKTIDIKNINQFEIMFKKIQLNYCDESFQEFHRKKIINQIKLVKKFAQ